jgi:hypothetical protein
MPYAQTFGLHGVTRDIRGAARSLEQSLSRILAGRANFASIEVRVSVRKIGGSGRAPELGCVVVVIGDTQEDADRHCMELQEQGCICRFTGPNTCECDCSPVEEH